MKAKSLLERHERTHQPPRIITIPRIQRMRSAIKSISKWQFDFMRRAVMVSRLFYLVDGKRVDSLFVMKNLPGMDLEASPAPSEVINQTREVHKIDLGLGGYNKG